MQHMNWNDFRYVLAISRQGRLAEAAKLLRVDDTTVSRRLATLEAAMGQRLYQRLASGRLELTEAGQAVAAIAERMDRDVGALERGHSDYETVSGVIRLTSVPFVINRILVPAAGRLLERHSGLSLELVSDSRDLSLTRREADMALRLARPKTGGMRVKARRVGVLHYASYDAMESDRTAASSRPWITYDETMAHLPQARWMDAAINKEAGQAAPLRVNDVEAALEAVAAGYGRSMLPCLIADRDSRLRKTRKGTAPEPPTRELWLLIHAELSELPRTQAVAKWIEDLFSKGLGRR